MHGSCRKFEKPTYQSLLSDLDSLGMKTSLITIEIGYLGHSLPNCAKMFMRAFSNHFDKKSSRTYVTLFDDAAKTAISASHIIQAI